MMGHRPENTVVIEDSVHGVEAARAAGMRVIGFTGGAHSFAAHADNLTKAGATTIVTAMRDLPAALADLGA